MYFLLLVMVIVKLVVVVVVVHICSEVLNRSAKILRESVGRELYSGSRSLGTPLRCGVMHS